MNHSLTPNCSIQFDPQHAIIKVIAMQDIEDKEPLTLNYGNHTNLDMLLNWGFCERNNPKTAVELHTALDEQDPLYEEKKKLVDDEGKHGFIIGGTFDVSYNTALSRMRFYAAKDMSWVEEWRNKFFNEHDQNALRDPTAIVPGLEDPLTHSGWIRSIPKPKYNALNILTPQNLENEVEAWRLMHKFSEATAAKYPQTLEEDIALLKKDEEEKHLTYNQRNCLILRYEEKNILNNLMDAYEIVKKWSAM